MMGLITRALDEARALRKDLRRLTSRVDAMVTKAVINRVNESLKTARLQVTILKDEEEEQVELVGPFGFHMSPPAGAEGVALAVGGYRSHTVVVGVSAPGSRPTDAGENEGGIYQLGEWALFVDADGVLHIFPGDGLGEGPIGRGDKTDVELAAISAVIKTLCDSVGISPIPWTFPGTAPANTPPLRSVGATKGKVT